MVQSNDFQGNARCNLNFRHDHLILTRTSVNGDQSVDSSFYKIFVCSFTNVLVTKVGNLEV